MAVAPRLVRFAARYSRCVDDAEDAYQRAMEIALTRAPSTERDRFMAWLYAVLRNEAIAIARARGRETPSSAEDVELAAGPAQDPGPESRAEWRERYLAVSDALSRLTEAQRVCLMLQSAGASYSLIGEITGFSTRKIERSVLEGRTRLRDWEVRITEGDGCVSLEGALDRVARGEATRGDRRQVTRHTRHCRGCRALLASRRNTAHWMGALVPVGLLGGGLANATPDPGPYLAALDRAAAGATVRAGQALQVMMELPGSGVARAGAAAGAIILALWAAVPMVSHEVGRGETGPPASEAAPAAATSRVSTEAPSIVERVLAQQAPASPSREPSSEEAPRTSTRPPAQAAVPHETTTAERAAREILAEPPPGRTGSRPPATTTPEPATVATERSESPTGVGESPAAGTAVPDSLDPGFGGPSVPLPSPSGGALATSIGP